MECPAITEARKNILESHRPHQEDNDRTRTECLLFGHKTEGTICRKRDDFQNSDNIGEKSYIKNIEEIKGSYGWESYNLYTMCHCSLYLSNG